MRLPLLTLAIGVLMVSAAMGWGAVSADERDPIVLVSNAEVEASLDSSDFSKDRAQEFATGNNPQGYTVTGVRLAFRVNNPDGDPVTFRTELWSLDGEGGTAVSLLGTFENPEALADSDHGEGGAYFAAPGDGFKLQPRKSYLVLFEILGLGTIDASIRGVRSSQEDLSGEHTWSIHTRHRYRDQAQTGAQGTWMLDQHPLWLRVEGHKDLLAPTTRQVAESSPSSRLYYVTRPNTPGTPCANTPRPGLSRNEQLANVRLVCDASTNEWVKVQYARAGIDYATDRQLQAGNRATNGCSVAQRYDPIRKVCLTYAPTPVPETP